MTQNYERVNTPKKIGRVVGLTLVFTLLYAIIEGLIGVSQGAGFFDTISANWYLVFSWLLLSIFMAYMIVSGRMGLFSSRGFTTRQRSIALGCALACAVILIVIAFLVTS
ncbi:hypothetical protein [Trueperella sp. LYQ141]|uniref:hypothetical protein n=1 Tax=Trueperella sp. LYQ141 TaxID=3391058 RepID=UPI003982DBDC